MSRIPLVAVEEMNSEQRAQYGRFPSNLTRGLLLADQRLSEALPNLANALRASQLDAALREAVILRVAALSNSAYERMQHLGQVEKAGWTAAEIAAIEAGNFSSLRSDVGAVLRFVDECVANLRVSDPTFVAVRELLSDRDIATLILLAGHYMMVARFTATLEIELDEKPDAWSSEH